MGIAPFAGEALPALLSYQDRTTRMQTHGRQTADSPRSLSLGAFFRRDRGYGDFTNVVATGLFARQSNAFEVGRVTPARRCLWLGGGGHGTARPTKYTCRV